MMDSIVYGILQHTIACKEKIVRVLYRQLIEG